MMLNDMRRKEMKYMIKFIKLRGLRLGIYRGKGIYFGYMPSRGFAQFLLLSRLIWEAWLMYVCICLNCVDYFWVFLVFADSE